MPFVLILWTSYRYRGLLELKELQENLVCRRYLITIIEINKEMIRPFLSLIPNFGNLVQVF